MSRLAREIAFGLASSFRSKADFTAPSLAPPPGRRPPLERCASEPFAPPQHPDIGRFESVPSLPRPAAPACHPLPGGLREEEQPLLEPGEAAEAEAGQAAGAAPAATPDQQALARREETMLAAEGAAMASAAYAMPSIPEGSAVSQPAPADAAAAFARRVRLGINASWAVNVGLLLAKVSAFLLSSSYSVLASAVDSLVDLLSQGLLAVAEHQAATYDPRYPIGRTRAAELAVMGCALVMFVSTALVVQEAAGALWAGFHGHPPSLEVGPAMYCVMGGASAFKLALWLYCRTLQRNPIMIALAQDHVNDVMSNVAAVGGAAIASHVLRAWWADAGMALLFSLVIIWNWVMIVKEQSDNIVGRSAPDGLVAEVEAKARSHHPHMQLTRAIAYHHGAHYAVEVSVMLPPHMSVQESHDITHDLQDKLESLDEVERAYVHVDYRLRDEEEHKVERNLKLGIKDVMSAAPQLPPAAQQQQQQPADVVVAVGGSP